MNAKAGIKFWIEVECLSNITLLVMIQAGFQLDPGSTCKAISTTLCYPKAQYIQTFGGGPLITKLL